MRSKPLPDGETYKFVVYPAGSAYLAEASVAGRQKLSVAGRSWDSVKIDLKLSKINEKTLELEPHTKFKHGSIWLSDDSNRILLRVNAEIFVGSVWAELQSVDFH